MALSMESKPGKKSKKNKGQQAAAVNQEKEQEADSTAWKGKPSQFFVMKKIDGPVQDPTNPNNFELNGEQMSFIFLHYPEYSAAPYEMMTWLYGQAKQEEDRYARPKVGGVATAVDETEVVEDVRPNPKGTGIGGAQSKKQTKKKDDRDAQD